MRLFEIREKNNKYFLCATRYLYQVYFATALVKVPIQNISICYDTMLIIADVQWRWSLFSQNVDFVLPLRLLMLLNNWQLLKLLGRVWQQRILKLVYDAFILQTHLLTVVSGWLLIVNGYRLKSFVSFVTLGDTDAPEGQNFWLCLNFVRLNSVGITQFHKLIMG